MDAAYLLSFKGANGHCARLGELKSRLAAMDESPARTSPGITMGHGGGASDPTQRDALALIRRKERLSKEIDELETLIGNVGSLMRSAPHGELVIDYYLDEKGDITWGMLALEADVTLRTMFRWRDACLAWIERNGNVC